MKSEKENQNQNFDFDNILVVKRSDVSILETRTSFDSKGFIIKDTFVYRLRNGTTVLIIHKPKS